MAKMKRKNIKTVESLNVLMQIFRSSVTNVNSPYVWWRRKIMHVLNKLECFNFMPKMERYTIYLRKSHASF